LVDFMGLDTNSDSFVGIALAWYEQLDAMPPFGFAGKTSLALRINIGSRAELANTDPKRQRVLPFKRRAGQRS